MANALSTGGKLLFTAPSHKMKWKDAIIAMESIPLGADRYNALMVASRLLPTEEFEDKGKNHYYYAEKL